ncbi:RICIN domain-containing protein [Lentzea sp. PSKA42]|uniref:RICIN domain-containing protein n=1 Tax=Lentzea indica TaxID=2604800 RepID=A0ABX1FPL2_9PSEU|nr:RICIN domain-containing protein [Lentzea indica]
MGRCEHHPVGLRQRRQPEVEVRVRGRRRVRDLQPEERQLIDAFGASTADNASVVQWADNNGANQRWQLVDAGNGYVKLRNVNSGKGARCVRVVHHGG